MADTAASTTILIPRQVVQLTAAQEHACTTLLQPLLPAVEQLLLRLRLDEDTDLALRYPRYGSKPYPLGRCLEIRDAVFTRFQHMLNGRLPAAADELPTLERLHQYLANGGICHKVWGSLRRTYFQNAIQLGNWYVDVANDTVVTTKPKIEILPMAGSGFANIEDYRHFADVARSYWQVEVYANTVFPQLAPLFPLVCHNDKGGWLAPGYDELIQLTRRDAFAPSEAILQELPPVPAALRDWFATKRRTDQPLLSMEGDAVAACRTARARGLMYNHNYRQALVAAYKTLPQG